VRHVRRGADGLAGDRRVGIREQRPEEVVERRRHPREQSRGLLALAHGIRTTRGDHRLEQRARGLGVVRRGEERGDPRADREIGEVAELLDHLERIGAFLARDVQQRLGADADVRVAEKAAGGSRDLWIAAPPEHPEHPAPHLRRGMGAEGQQRRLELPERLARDEVECREDLLRVTGRQPQAHDAGRQRVARGRRVALVVEAVAVDRVLDGAHVFDAQPPDEQRPRGDQHQVGGGRAAHAEPEPAQHEETLRRKAQEDGARRVREAVDDDVDRRLDDAALGLRDRQVQQLVRRLVHREAEPLVEAGREQHRPEHGHQDDQQAAGPERDGQQEDCHGDAEAPERRTGQRKLEHERQHADHEVVRPEERRECVGVVPITFVGHEAELKSDPLRDDRDDEDERRHQHQVTAAADRAQAVHEARYRLPRQPRPVPTARLHLRGQLDAGGHQDEDREHEQHVDRAADRPDQHARHHAARDRAQRRPGADDAEQAPRLARVEERVREAPRLHRRDDGEAVDPDVERARQEPGQTGPGVRRRETAADRVRAKRRPERQDVQR
jgi:hypothetical protein